MSGEVRETERERATPCLSLSAGRSIQNTPSPSARRTRKQTVICSLPHITKRSFKAQTVYTSKTSNEVPPQTQTKRNFSPVCSFTSISAGQRDGKPRNRGSLPGMEKSFSLFCTASRPAMGPIQPPIERAPVELPKVIKVAAV